MSFSYKYNNISKQIQRKTLQIRKVTHENIFGQVRRKKMASAVVYQPTSSKIEDTKNLKKILHDEMMPDKKTLDKMIDEEEAMDEKSLKKILPDKRFLRNVMPTSEAVVKLLDGVEGVVINQKVEVVETAMGILTLGCCKVGKTPLNVIS